MEQQKIENNKPRTPHRDRSNQEHQLRNDKSRTEIMHNKPRTINQMQQIKNNKSRLDSDDKYIFYLENTFLLRCMNHNNITQQ